jgi:hypothetical protein
LPVIRFVGYIPAHAVRPSCSSDEP